MVISSEGRYWTETYDELKVSKVAFAANVMLSFVPFGAAAGLLVAFACALFDGGFARELFSGDINLLACPAGAVVLMALLVRYFRENECVSLGRILIPFFIPLALLVLPWSGVNSKEMGSAFLALLMLFLPTMWLMPAELIKRYRLSAPVSYGFHRAAFSVGALVSVALISAADISLVSNLGVSIVVLVLVAIGFFALITEERMGKLVERAQPREKGELPESDTYALYEKCKAVSDIYLLSQREHEILCLLARGRNAAFIQSKLTISEGTVRTHMRNIYRKIDVHSQQELMDLVESAGGVCN